MRLGQALSNSTNSYQALNQLVRASRVELSNFGSRVVSVPGHEGTISLAEVSKKWVNLGRDNNKVYSIEECRAAMAIQFKLQSHYDTSDAMINESNNIFVVFSRVMRSCALFFVRLFGVDADNVYVLYPFRPSHRKAVELIPEKISLPVFDQANRLGLVT